MYTENGKPISDYQWGRGKEYGVKRYKLQRVKEIKVTKIYCIT